MRPPKKKLITLDEVMPKEVVLSFLQLSRDWEWDVFVYKHNNNCCNHMLWKQGKSQTFIWTLQLSSLYFLWESLCLLACPAPFFPFQVLRTPTDSNPTEQGAREAELRALTAVRRSWVPPGEEEQPVICSSLSFYIHFSLILSFSICDCQFLTFSCRGTLTYKKRSQAWVEPL